MMELGKVRSDLILVEVLLSRVEALEVGFLGIMTSGKLPKVKEKPAAVSICAATLVEKTTPVLATIELDVGSLSPLSSAPTVRLLFRPVHQGCTGR